MFLVLFLIHKNLPASKITELVSISYYLSLPKQHGIIQADILFRIIGSTHFRYPSRKLVQFAYFLPFMLFRILWTINQRERSELISAKMTTVILSALEFDFNYVHRFWGSEV